MVTWQSSSTARFRWSHPTRWAALRCGAGDRVRLGFDPALSAVMGPARPLFVKYRV